MTTCSVNLVPEAAQHKMRRARRLRCWVGAQIGAALLTGLLAMLHASRSQDRKTSADALVSVQARQAGLAHEQELLDRQRLALLERSDLLRRITPPKPWPSRLTQMARDLPDQIVLTSLRGSISTPQTSPSTSGQSATANRSRASAPASAPASEFELDVQGLALGQPDVTSLIDSLQRMPGLARADLMRAVHESRAAGELVRFQIACHGKESAP